MSEILIGMAGWSYDDWRNVVYPPGSPGRFDRLAYLASLFDTLEINSSFYRIPSRRSVESWLERISDRPNFTFSAKLYHGLTHERDKTESDKLLTEYTQAVEPIHAAGRLAAVLMQFPWSFKFNADNLSWIEMLTKRLNPFPLAVEVRHASWLNDEYLDFLRTKNIAFCNIDQPPIRGNIPPTEWVTSEFSYARLHGRNAQQWFTENEEASDRYNYHYNSNELADWSARLRRIAQKAQRVYVYLNNHVGGQGVANALQLKSLLTGKPVPAPLHLMLAFPELGT